MKKYRTLIRVEEHDDKHIIVIIPGFNIDQKVPILKEHIPVDILEYIMSYLEQEKICRIHAQCNIGAESFKDLKFSQWEK